MPRLLLLSGWLFGLSLSSVALAQDVTAGLAAAQSRIEAQEWDAALEVLLGLQEVATGEAELEQLAAKLDEVRSALQDASAFERALGAGEASLALRKRLHGDRDHMKVAASLSNLANCLHSLGRSREALPQLEASLAMNKRLHGDGDHPTVAAGLNNVASVLQALGRSGEALPGFEASLAMNKRLHGDRDHPAAADALNNVAMCLQSLARSDEALPLHEAGLAMRRRLYGERDHPDVAQSLGNAASCLSLLGRVDEALALNEVALAMNKRLHGDRDHPAVALSLNNVASCLESLGRSGEALPGFESSLAMRQRLHGDRDQQNVAQSLNNVANCLQSLGRSGEALPGFEASLAMRQRLHGDRDHPDVAASLGNVAGCLKLLGRVKAALPHFEAALAMNKRLYGHRDHSEVAVTLNNLASCLMASGRCGEALPQYEASLAMNKRLHRERDHPEVAIYLNNVASCLLLLGRASEALPQYEASLVMRRRLYDDRDHPDVAASLGNVAACLQSLGRPGDALPQFEASLAMRQRLYGDRDHPEVAVGLGHVAGSLRSLGRHGEALPQIEAMLAMYKRIHGKSDHPAVATGLNGVAVCLESLGRSGEALPQIEASLAMFKRLHGDSDHPDVVIGLTTMTACLESLGRPGESLSACRLAVAMIERLRDESRTSATLRQSLFDRLKRGGVVERMQDLTAQRGGAADSLHAAERGRGRELLDLLEQQRGDAFEVAILRAAQRGDTAAATRLSGLRQEMETVEHESDRLLHQLTRLADAQIAGSERDSRRQELLTHSNDVSTRRRQLLDERARLLGDVLPVGRVRTASEIQAALWEGEMFLEFTVTKDVSWIYVLARDGEVAAIPLATAYATAQRVLPELLRRSSHAQLTDTRGRDPEEASAQPAADASLPARELFASLIPQSLWLRIRTARRVFVAAHRELHRLPFELLVTDVVDGKPVHWLENGPAIAYVPSGSVLHWLRQRSRDASDDATSLDLLAVGDPGELEVEPEVPAQGVFVVLVNEGAEGARAGLQPRDVLLRYDGRELEDDKSLRDARTATDAAIEDGQRADTAIPLEVWRRGETVRLEVRKGVLGIQVGQGKARDASEAALGSDAQLARITRSGDLERLRQLPPLRDARLETQAIESVFAAAKGKTKRLLGANATEPAVFDLAPKAKFLHFACHGLAEEYAGQSLSMLVLSQPHNVLPGDDGLLKLSDLLHNWTGRLSSCRLVVLSACRTNVGPTLRDEAPQALPIGFLFAGVPAVISSLWAVDDASTRELMTDFYSRLLAGETDKIAAFTAAKKALRQKYPDPFHWAPFLYIGSPE